MNLEGYSAPVKAPSTITNERQEILKRFVDKQCIMVSDRKGGYRLVTGKELANILALIPTCDLHVFYKQCEQARSFSKYFWWAIKSRETIELPREWLGKRA